MIKKLIILISGFSVVGALSTLLSVFLLYISVNCCGLKAELSYVISYVISLAFSYGCNARLVFKARVSLKGFVQYLLAYVSGMLLGVVLVKMLRTQTRIDPFFITCGVIPITTLWNFVFANVVFSKRKKVDHVS